MNHKPVLSLILAAHTPFTALPDDTAAGSGACGGGAGNAAGDGGEWRFFETVSETLLPLLAVFDRLERDHVPFRVGLVLSPTLCHLLESPAMAARYLAYTEAQLELGSRELNRLEAAGDEPLAAAWRTARNGLVERRELFSSRWGGRLIPAFDHFRRGGRVEFLATAATHAFLPFYTAHPPALQAEFETALTALQDVLGSRPQGFWLPEMGWSPPLDDWLGAYNFAYTVVDTPGLLYGRPTPLRGAFYPVRTPGGVVVLGRDFYAAREIEEFRLAPEYRNPGGDAAFSLPPDLLGPFLTRDGGRIPAGYVCRARHGGPYDAEAAARRARDHARTFLENRRARLEAAGAYFSPAAAAPVYSSGPRGGGLAAEKLPEAAPVSFCAFNADAFGRYWREGPLFLETLFREGAGSFQFMTPAEYLFRQEHGGFQTLTPAFSSWAPDGYGTTWADASNGWTYRHLIRALERMTRLAERFPRPGDELRERLLNQAAREALLALASDWPGMLSRRESPRCAQAQIEACLRNFTTIYESLGSASLNPEWLTTLERRHRIFPHITYQVFRPCHGRPAAGPLPA